MSEESAGMARRPRIAHPRGGLATVGDDDRIVIERLRDLVRHARGMNRAVLIFECVVEAMTLGIANRGQPLDPFLMRIELLALRRIDGLAHELAAIRNDAELDIRDCGRSPRARYRPGLRARRAESPSCDRR